MGLLEALTASEQGGKIATVVDLGNPNYISDTPEGLASTLEHCSRSQYLPKICKEDYTYLRLFELKFLFS